MEKKLRDWWDELKKDFTEYLQARAQLTKIQAYEKVAKVIGVTISFFILALMAAFVIIFFLVMIGTWVAQLTHSFAIGFSSVALLTALLFLLLAVKRKSILETPVSAAVIKALFHADADAEEKSPGDED